ncbi:hypothetical protein Tco_0891857 [Tanacetum coccineum]|uniref:Uncharacterized protein n=1 Tax=Tanacetum coccineum TaxID=301880 RepID=A0ABQ5C4E5_9ASTR
MLTRSMAAKLIAALASECLFVVFLSEIEPKKVSEQDDKGISIYQEKYIRDLLKKYEISDNSLVKTPVVPPNNLGPDLAGKPVNENLYRGMIESLMYLKGTSSLGLWYLRCLGFDLKGYSESDYIADDNEARPLKESNINFTMKNGKMPLVLSYKTFCQTMGLDYNNGNYVSHPFTEEVKIEVLGGNHSSTEQLNLSQQLIVFGLLTETKIDIGEIIYNDLVTKLMAKSRQRTTNLVSPLPAYEKTGKKKTQTVTKPKPKSQGPKTSGALPKMGKKAETKKTTLIQTRLNLTKERVPSRDTDTSQ